MYLQWNCIDWFSCTEIVVTNIHPGLEELLDSPKDQGEELLKVNLEEERKEAQHIFISSRLSDDLKQNTSWYVKRNQRHFCMDICWDAKTLSTVGDVSSQNQRRN